MKRLSNDLKLTDTIVSFKFFFLERWGWAFHLCHIILAIIILCCFCGFCCFQFYLGLEKGHKTVCYLDTLCLGNVWHIFPKNVIEMESVQSLNTAFRIYSILEFFTNLLLGFFKTEYCFLYIYHCIDMFLIQNFTNFGIADNQRWFFKVQFQSFHKSKICH